MWNRKRILAYAVLGVGYVMMVCPDQGWAASAGPAPSADIDVLGGAAVNCAGTGWAVPVTKAVVLTAINLEDQDYDNGCELVDDNISNPAGIQWVVGATGTYGTFTGGDLGSPKTWTAQAVEANNVSVILKLKDDGNPVLDNTTHKDAESLALDLAVPTSATRVYQNDTTCGAGLKGGGKHYHWTAVSHACALDFSGLTFEETVSFDWGTCNPIDDVDTGIYCVVGATNTVVRDGGDCNDTYSMCYPLADCKTCQIVVTQNIWVADSSNVIVTKTITFNFTKTANDCTVTIAAP